MDSQSKGGDSANRESLSKGAANDSVRNQRVPVRQSDIDLVVRSLRRDISQHPDFIEPISEIISIRRLLNEYKDQRMSNSIDDFEKQVIVWRSSRGDGNCFYRAFFFYYLEKLLAEGQVREIELMAESVQSKALSLKVLDQRSLNSYEIREFYENVEEYFVACLRVCTHLKGSRAELANKLRILFKELPEFDMAGVLYARAVALKGMSDNQSRFESFLSSGECHSIRENLRLYGGEGDQVPATAIADVLNVRIYAQQLQAGGNKAWQILPQARANAGPPKMDVYLFYRKGHYDLCYSRAEAHEYYENEYQADVALMEQQLLAMMRREAVASGQHSELCLWCGATSQLQRGSYNNDVTCRKCLQQQSEYRSDRRRTKLSEKRQLVYEILMIQQAGDKSWIEIGVNTIENGFCSSKVSTLSVQESQQNQKTAKNKKEKTFWKSLMPGHHSSEDEKEDVNKNQVQQLTYQLNEIRRDFESQQMALIQSQTQVQDYQHLLNAKDQTIAVIREETNAFNQKYIEVQKQLQELTIKYDKIRQDNSILLQAQKQNGQPFVESAQLLEKHIPQLSDSLAVLMKVQESFQFLNSYRNAEWRADGDRELTQQVQTLKIALEESDKKCQQYEKELKDTKILLLSYETAKIVSYQQPQYTAAYRNMEKDQNYKNPIELQQQSPSKTSAHAQNLLENNSPQSNYVTKEVNN